MQFNVNSGHIGFESDEGDHGHISQWWVPTNEELVEFVEDAMFWASTQISPALDYLLGL